MIILEGEQRTPEWLAARMGRITGTRMADAMAGEKTKTYTELVRILAWERAYGEPAKANYTNAAMQHGIDTEAEAMAWYAFGCEHACVTPMFVIGALDFVGVSPDLLVGSDGMAQLKCPQPLTHMETITDPRLPAEYRYQVQGEMWVCERVWSDFVSYHPKHGGIVVRVPRDDELIEKLKARCIQVNDEANRFAETLTKKEAA